MDATWHPRGVTQGMSHVLHLCEWLTLSHVSKEGNKKKKKIDEKMREKGKMENEKKNEIGTNKERRKCGG